MNSDTPVEDLSSQFQTLKTQLSERILGQPDLIEAVLVAMVAGGHILLEGLPGLGKTELIKTKKIDRLPSNITSDSCF